MVGPGVLSLLDQVDPVPPHHLAVRVSACVLVRRCRLYYQQIGSVFVPMIATSILTEQSSVSVG
jgi:hypothetical protein